MTTDADAVEPSAVPHVLQLSAYAQNLRARALGEGLRGAGWRLTSSRGRGRRGTAWEIAATIVPNCWLAMRTDADLALGCKPHPNVAWPLAICRLRGIPTWLDVDDLDHAYRPGWAGRVVAWLQRPHPRRADVVTYHHPRLRDDLVGRLGCDPDRTLAVEQGVDVDRFARGRARLSAHDGRPRAVYAAHLNLACDLEVVLAAWREVVRRRPRAVLTVVGGGARLAEFRRLVALGGLVGSVELVGAVRPGEVPAYLAGADVAVTWATDRPVNWHRCSLKLREYLASGVPVVSNGVGELVDFASVTYQVGSEAELPDELVRRLDGETDGRELAGRSLAAEMDWQPIVTRAATAVAGRVGIRPPPDLRRRRRTRPEPRPPQPVRLTRRRQRAPSP